MIGFTAIDLSCAVGMTGTHLRDFADRHRETLTSLRLRNVGIPVTVVDDGVHKLDNDSTEFVVADEATVVESDVAYLCAVCIHLASLDVSLGDAEDPLRGNGIKCYERDDVAPPAMEVARSMFTGRLATTATVDYTGRKFK
jgi:hypothetical protein